MFPTTCATSASLSEPTRAGDRHTMPARSPFVGGILSRAVGVPGIMFATLDSLTDRLGWNPYHLSLKVTNIPPDQISTPILWNIWSVASYQFSLKPLTNSYKQDLPPCRQHCSTPLIIKILLIPLTGPDNPLLCHYFCYYLRWVYGNETIGNTLNCSYGELGEEFSDLHSLRAVRG